ncbi:MAG: hypothetical protein L6R39_006037, partial [Caloplaca ligustica]
MSKIVVYTGAPLSCSLTWDEEHLITPLQPCFKGIQQLPTRADIDIGPKWRSLPLQQQHLPTGLTQTIYPDFVPTPSPGKEETSFLSTSAFSSTQDVDAPSSSADQDPDILSQYYEHSFAVHDDLPPSHILPAT